MGADGLEQREASTRDLTRLAASLAVPDSDAWAAALSAAAGSCSEIEIEEVLLQSHLFVGFPVVLNALILWADLRDDAASLDVGDRSVDIMARRERGEAVCRTVYGKAYEQLRDNVRSLSPEIDRWMIEDGYGKTLSRSGLSLVVRELCVVAQLAAGRHDRQLRAHLFGALNAGASFDEVDAALREGIEASGGTDGADDTRIDIWDEVRQRATG